MNPIADLIYSRPLALYAMCVKTYSDCINLVMKAVFVELPPFERYREDYLDCSHSHPALAG